MLCLATAFLSDKTIGSYRQVFQVVNDEIHNLTGNNWIPTNCIADFELAIITAFETEFPNCNIYGCFFHYCKSIWRHIKGLGLMRGYRQDNRLKRCLKKIMSLGFLPLALLRMNYAALVARRRTRRLVETYPALEDFFNYFNRNYMNGNFPPVTWNVFQRPMEFRTNNFVESYHSRWNDAVAVRHPSLWNFIRVLRDQQQAVQEAVIENIRNGNPPPKRKRKWRILEGRINSLKEEYGNGERNLESYWHAVTYCVP